MHVWHVDVQAGDYGLHMYVLLHLLTELAKLANTSVCTDIANTDPECINVSGWELLSLPVMRSCEMCKCLVLQRYVLHTSW